MKSKPRDPAERTQSKHRKMRVLRKKDQQGYRNTVPKILTKTGAHTAPWQTATVRSARGLGRKGHFASFRKRQSPAKAGPGGVGDGPASRDMLRDRRSIDANDAWTISPGNSHPLQKEGENQLESIALRNKRRAAKKKAHSKKEAEDSASRAGKGALERTIKDNAIRFRVISAKSHWKTRKGPAAQSAIRRRYSGLRRSDAAHRVGRLNSSSKTRGGSSSFP